MLSIRKIVSKTTIAYFAYIVVLAGIIIFTVFGESGLYKLHSLYNTRHKLNYQIKENNTKIELLKREKLRLANPTYLESIIRKELGYIKDGEVVYQITP